MYYCNIPILFFFFGTLCMYNKIIDPQLFKYSYTIVHTEYYYKIKPNFYNSHHQQYKAFFFYDPTEDKRQKKT